MSQNDVCRRQILTSIVDSRTEQIQLFIMVVDHDNIGIQIKPRELTKPFMLISN